MSGIGTLSGIALERPDPAALADFYSQVAGWPIVQGRMEGRNGDPARH